MSKLNKDYPPLARGTRQVIAEGAWQRFARFNEAAPFSKLGLHKQAGEEGIIEILFYGVISEYGGWDGEITPNDFHAALKEAGDEKICLRINSPGGHTSAGAAMQALLQDYKGDVEVKIDGLCASAATFIAYARQGQSVVMGKMAEVMIHNPWCLAIGDARDLRKTADDMDNYSEAMIALYAERTGKTDAAVKKMMDNETYLNAAQAVENRFADRISGKDESAGQNASAGGQTPSIMPPIDKGEEKQEESRTIPLPPLSRLGAALQLKKPGV